jgi:hypothetical protein
MPRRDRFDEHEEAYERDPPRRPSGTSPVLIVGLVLGALLVLLVVGGLVLMVSFWAAPDGGRPPAAAQAAGPVDTTKRIYTRGEFKELVIGKTPDEVIAAVGKADRTVESGTDVFWYYDARTTNPATGEADKKAQVVFRNGKAAEVNY